MENSDKKLIITPLGGSKELSQVLANDTCRLILDTVSDEALSTSQVANTLGLNLSTVDYNIKKLEAVGLVEVSHKKWSPKGRKVNYYAPANKFIVILPKFIKGDVLKALKGVLPIIGAGALVIGGALGWFLRGRESSQVSFMSGEGASQVSGIAGERAAGGMTGFMMCPGPSIYFYIMLICILAALVGLGWWGYKKYGGLKK